MLGKKKTLKQMPDAKHTDNPASGFIIVDDGVITYPLEAEWRAMPAGHHIWYKWNDRDAVAICKEGMRIPRFPDGRKYAFVNEGESLCTAFPGEEVEDFTGEEYTVTNAILFSPIGGVLEASYKKKGMDLPIPLWMIALLVIGVIVALLIFKSGGGSSDDIEPTYTPGIGQTTYQEAPVE